MLQVKLRTFGSCMGSGRWTTVAECWLRTVQVDLDRPKLSNPVSVSTCLGYEMRLRA